LLLNGVTEPSLTAAVLSPAKGFRTHRSHIRIRTNATIHGVNLSLFPIHSRTYGGQFLSSTPAASHSARNFTASLSTNRTSARSQTTAVEFPSASLARSFCNSTTCSSSIRPLRIKVTRPLFSDLRIWNIVRKSCNSVATCRVHIIRGLQGE
jgi:hypothetical protein